jgi:trehalose 2-sulfotransferase
MASGSARDGATAPPRCLLVATTPRSGSWLLSDYLSQSSVIGPAREYFHVSYVGSLCAEWGLAERAITAGYVDRVLELGREGGKLFATKLHWLQINQLVDSLRLIHPDLAVGPAPELIEASLPHSRYLHLIRRNKARQALSLYKAMRSETWWVANEDAAGAPQVDLDPSPVADNLTVRWFEDQLRAEDAEWARYFTVFSITPLTIVYEDLVADPEMTIRNVLDWLDLDSSGVPPLQAHLRRQSGEQTERELVEYLEIRNLLPPRPDHWQWSFGRRAFGHRDTHDTGPPNDLGGVPSARDLSPL